MKKQEIFDLASSCEHSFKEVLGSISSLSDPLYRPILQHHQRFESWAGFMGVFAEVQASLDRRLTFSPELREAVLQLLLLVHTSLHRVLDLEQNGMDSNGPETVPITQYNSPQLDQQIVHPTRRANSALETINGSIDRLQRIAVAIRKYSISNIVSEVQIYSHKFNDGDGFEDFALVVVQWVYPQMTKTLAKQLAFSIAFRRLRLLYQRRHQQKLEQRRQLPHHYHKHGTQRDHPLPHDEVQAIQQEVLETRSELQKHGVSHELLSATEHSVLDIPPTQDVNQESQSMKSGSTIISSIAQDYLYPAPPVPQAESKYVYCSWCFEEINVARLRIPGLWRSHFKKDLEPYVCISEKCQEPPIFFSTIGDWQKHMKNTHTKQWPQEIHKPSSWFCDITKHSHTKLIHFDKAEDLQAHLRQDHDGSISIAKMESKVRRNTLSQARDEGLCPLCHEDLSVLAPGSENGPDQDRSLASQNASSSGQRQSVRFQLPENESSSEDELVGRERIPITEQHLPNTATSKELIQLKLCKHIARHLKSLAFLSLRWFDDDSSSSNGDKDSSGGRRGRTSQDSHSSTQLHSVGSDEISHELADLRMWRYPMPSFKAIQAHARNLHGALGPWQLSGTDQDLSVVLDSYLQLEFRTAVARAKISPTDQIRQRPFRTTLTEHLQISLQWFEETINTQLDAIPRDTDYDYEYTPVSGRVLGEFSPSRLLDVTLQPEKKVRFRLWASVLTSHNFLQLVNTPWLTGSWRYNLYVQPSLQKHVSDHRGYHFFIRSSFQYGKYWVCCLCQDGPKVVDDEDTGPCRACRAHTRCHECICKNGRPYWSGESCEPLISPEHVRDKGLYDLGVLLIELAYWEPLPWLLKPDDGPPDTSLAYWRADNRLCDEVSELEGPQYAEAARRCIRCEFGGLEPDFEDDDFLKAVYESVVQPLQEHYLCHFPLDAEPGEPNKAQHESDSISTGESVPDTRLQSPFPSSSSFPTSKVLQCDVDGCESVFTGEYRKGNLNRHKKLRHKETKRHSCEAKDCAKSFARKDARSKHYRYHHPELVTAPIQRR